MNRIPQVVIDTDMGFDDLMAILYLLNRQDIDVAAITINGNSCCHSLQGAVNALKLLNLVGKTAAEIPVACGSEQPLDGFHAYPDDWRVDADALYGVPLANNRKGPATLPAVDLLISLLTNAAEPVTILGIGAMTNIAEALERKPAIRARIGSVVMMAGDLQVKEIVGVPDAAEHSGSAEELASTVTDWNTYVDPLAAKLVFCSGVPITLVPLAATNYVPLTHDFAMLFKAKARSPEARFLDAVFDYCTDFIKAGVFYCWDPLAAAAIVDRDLLQFRRQQLEVIMQYAKDGLDENADRFTALRWDGKPRRAFDRYENGQIVESAAGQWVEVCAGVDAPAFYKRFIEVINGQALG